METFAICSDGLNSDAINDIAKALAHFEHVEAGRFTARFRQKDPNIKQLVLAAVPTASVRRSPTGRYECFVGNRRVVLKGHPVSYGTAQQAWIFFAHVVESRDSAALG